MHQQKFDNVTIYFKILHLLPQSKQYTATLLTEIIELLLLYFIL